MKTTAGWGSIHPMSSPGKGDPTSLTRHRGRENGQSENQQEKPKSRVWGGRKAGKSILAMPWGGSLKWGSH